jgi:ABC-type multidrug transport system ATPase subunit
MNIELENVGKRFGKNFIFRNINGIIPTGAKLGIVGANGSGKSTLLQIIAGLQPPTEGLVHRGVEEEVFNAHYSFCSPALGLYEDYTLEEHLRFYNRLKPLSISIEDCIEILDLSDHVNKRISHFSSGMKQRVKLAQACFSNTSILFLDEPCAHLDKKSEEWFAHLISETTQTKSVVIASNDHSVELSCVDEKWLISG